MEVFLILGGLAVLFVLVESGAAKAAPPPPTVSTGATVGASEAATGQEASIGITAVSAIPVVGPVVGQVLGAVLGPLLGASKARAAAATNENAAVASYIPAFDGQIAALFKALNSGQITASQASQGLQQIIAAYWANITPKIQAGRNGCASGTGQPSFKGGPSGGGACGTPAYTGCTGMATWGAACCIGSQLMASVANLQWLVAQPNGGSTTVCPIIGNTKYGGASRAGYTVSYTPAGIATTLESSILSAF